MSGETLLRRVWPRVLVALAFLATPLFEYSLLPGYYSAIMHLVPVALAALFLSTRAVVAVAALALAITLYYAVNSPVPLEVKAGRLLAFLTIAYLAIRLAQERERAVRHAREGAARETERRERARLEAVLQQMPSGVMIAEAAAGLVTFANEQVGRIWPRPQARPSGEGKRPPHEGLHHDGVPYAPDEWPLARALDGGEVVVDEEIRFPLPDGTLGTLSASAAPVRDEQGRIVAAVTVLTDVTARRQAEAEREQLLVTLQGLTEKLQEQNEALRAQDAELRWLAKESREQRERAESSAGEATRRAAALRATIDSMVDGVLAYNAEGSVVLANNLAHDLLGLGDRPEARVEELPQRAQLRHLDGRPVLPDETASAHALVGQVVTAQDQIAHNQRTGRDIYVRTNAAPILDDQGRITGAVVVIRDVTELLELDRLKDQFIQVAAHELKTPITIMKGYAQALIRSGQAGSPSQHLMLDAIDRGTDRIEGIINDLLDITKLQTGSLDLTQEQVNLAQLVKEQVDRLALTTTKHWPRLLKAQPVVILGDRHRLEQVVASLLDNAVRYSPEGGDVDVAVETAEGEVRVSVSDQGVGIPAEKQGRIFQRFYRAHTNTPHDYGGMGVGLFIACDIVRRHDGRMWFASEEGKGSTFYFALPMRATSD